MTLARTVLINSSNKSATNFGAGSYTPAGTFTPTAGRTLELVIFMCTNTNQGAPSGVTVTDNIVGGPLTWTPRATQYRTAGSDGIGVAVYTSSAVPGSPGTGRTVTVDATPSMYQWGVILSEYVDYSWAANSIGEDDTTTSGSNTQSLPTAPASTSMTFAAQVVYADATITGIAATGFTILWDSSAGTVPMCLIGDTDGSPSQTVGWSDDYGNGASGVTRCALAWEVADASAGASGQPFQARSSGLLVPHYAGRHPLGRRF